MTVDQIQKAISGNVGRVTKIAEQRRYAGGYNVAILGRKAHEEPDARIPIPIARKGIRLVTGYMAKPGNIIYSTKDKNTKGKGIVAKVKAFITGNKTDYVSGTLQLVFDANDEQLTTQEEIESALTYGHAWEYHYTEGNEPKFVEVPPEQCIPIWDDNLPPKLIGMIRYYETKDDDGEKKAEAYYYDGASIQEYSGKDFDSLSPQGEPVPHGYGEVPFNEYRIARDRSNLFDCVIPLIDYHDRVISEDYANEAQRFANSYLLLRDHLSAELDSVTGLSEVDKLKITRTFEGLGDNVTQAVAFLQKNIPIDFIKNTSDTFERLIYDMMQIINPNDIAATGQISGIALAYKLLQFEYFCASCEAYLSRGLQKRIKLIQNVTGAMSAEQADRPQVDIVFRRNLPFDMAAAVDMFVKVVGILPDEVALKLFPADFIPDAKAIAEEMAKNKAEMSVDSSDAGADDQAQDDKGE